MDGDWYLLGDPVSGAAAGEDEAVDPMFPGYIQDIE
jgi:hypothetical protein